MGAQCLLLHGNSARSGLLKQAGPYRLATELRNAGFETICIDIAHITPTKNFYILDMIINKFVDKDTLWVGISTTFFDNILKIPKLSLNSQKLNEEISYDNDEHFLYFLNKIKQKNKNIKFIVGGATYVNLQKYDFYHFRGYADYEIVEFTKWCKDSSYRPDIQRVGKVIECKEFKHFTTSNIRWHKNDIISPNDVLPIEISRGCIFKCKFCGFPLNGKTKGEWIKKYDVLLDEFLYNYENFGVTKYSFADDTYNDSVEKVTMLYEHVYSKLPFKISFTTYLRLDLMHRFKETEEILAKSGLKSAMFGIETNNPKSAKAVGKGLSFDTQIDYIREIKKTHFKDIITSSGFILGLPKDTKESIEDLGKFLSSDQNPLDHWRVDVLGINISEEAKHKNFMSDIDLNYKSYGYEVTPSGSKVDYWRLPAQGIDFGYCSDKKLQFMIEAEDLPNYRWGGHWFPYVSCVIPEDDIIKISRKEILQKYDIKKLSFDWHTNYFNSLWKL